MLIIMQTFSYVAMCSYRIIVEHSIGSTVSIRMSGHDD